MEFIILLSTLLPTIIIEWGVLLLMGEKSRKVLLCSLPINVVTNVPLNIFFATASINTILIAEFAIIIIEAALYYWATKDIKKSIIYSTLCNVTSFLTGIFIELIILLTI